MSPTMSGSLPSDADLYMDQASFLQDVDIDPAYLNNSLIHHGSLMFAGPFSALQNSAISSVGSAAIDPSLLQPAQDDTSAADLAFSLSNSGLFQRPRLPSRVQSVNEINHEPVAIRNEPWTSMALQGHSLTHPEPFQPPFERHTHPADSGYAGSIRSNQRTASSIPAPSRKRSLQTATSDSYDTFIKKTLPDQTLMNMPKSSNPRSTVPSSIADPEEQIEVGERYCQVCERSFGTKSEYSKHMARHIKTFKCREPDCKKGDGFATKNDLDRHLKTVHGKGGAETEFWRCLVPGCKSSTKNWPRQDNFKAHIERMHRGMDSDEWVKKSHDWFENVEKPKRLAEERGETGGSVTSNSQPPHGGTSINLSPLNALGSRHSVAGEPPYSGMSQYPLPDQPGFSTQRQLHTYPSNQIGMPNWNPYTLSNSTQGRSTSANHPVDTMVPSSNLYSFLTSTIPEIHAEFVDGHQSTHPSQMPEYDTRTAPETGAHAMNYQNFTFSPMTEPMGFYQDDSSFRQADNILSHVGTTLKYLSEQITDGLDQSMDDLPQQPSAMMGGPLAISPRESSNDGQPSVNEIISKLNAADPELLSKISKVIQDHQPSGNNSSARDESTPGEASTSGEPTSAKDDKPFQCGLCHKGFALKNVCVKHEKRHSKIWFCTFDECDKRSGSKQDLQRHENTVHTQEAGWRCWSKANSRASHKDCAEYFTDQIMFEKHCRDKHHNYPKRNMSEFKIERDFTGNFWCGFCNAVVENPTPGDINGTDRVKYRYTHIDSHLNEGLGTAHWHNLKGNNSKTKNQISAENSTDDDDEDGADEDEDAEASTPVTPSSVSYKRQRSDAGATRPNTYSKHLAPPPNFQPGQGHLRSHPPTVTGGPRSAPRHIRTPKGHLTPPGVPRAAALRRLTNPNTGRSTAGLTTPQGQFGLGMYIPCCECSSFSPIGDSGRCANQVCSHGFAGAVSCPNSTVDIPSGTISSATQ